MTRIPLSLTLPDLSAFARSLHGELATERPGHLALMNMAARSAGFRNLQHLRASAKAGRDLATPDPTADLTRVQTALRHFDAQGRFASWPARTAVQHLCLWALWSHLPRGQSLTERQISTLLTTWHLFKDAAILRRTLVELTLVTRTEGGDSYLRQERPPTPEARALIRHLHQIDHKNAA